MAERNYTRREFSAHCIQCGALFTYTHHTGQRPKICSEECRKASHRDHCAKNKQHLEMCSVDGCANRANRISAGLCEKHYGRVRRGVPLEDRKLSYSYTNQAGYVVRTVCDHPLADVGKRVYEHRAVAYDTHNGECPPCFWCGVGLDWASAVVDHLDEDKANNTPANLVVACSPCNRARGSMLPLIRRMQPQRLDLFASLIRAQNTKHHKAKTAEENSARVRYR